MSLCLHNSFCKNREQKVNVDLLPQTEHESWVTARNSLDMLQKVLEESEMGKQELEAMECRLKTGHEIEVERDGKLYRCSV